MTAWQQSAACRGMDPRLWDSDAGLVAGEIGRAVCERFCPVRDACAEAGRDEPENTWGGITAADRLALMLLATPAPPVHVPSRGCYVQGCQHPDCRAANARWQADYRAARRDVPATAGGTLDRWEQLELGVGA